MSANSSHADRYPEERSAADPLEPLVALLAERVAARVLALLDARLALPVPDPAPVGLVDKQTAARAIGVSAPTLDRFTREGAPVHHVGARRRFDVTELRAWLTARGKRPTTASATKREDAIDVSDVLDASGLRRA